MFIQIKNVYFQYSKDNPVIKGIDLEIERGEFVAIIGKNGCGKSTLSKLLNGLLIPTSGHILIDGLNTASPSNLLAIRKKASIVFQNPITQFVRTTVEEDVAFGPENLNVPTDKISQLVNNSLEFTSMSEFRYREPKTLSGGQMQRTTIAGVMAMEPECIIFDEVTSMLDQKGKCEIFAYINKLKKIGKTIIYVTHRIEEVLDADRFVHLDNGIIDFIGTPTDFFKLDNLDQMGIEVPEIVQLYSMLYNEGIIKQSLEITDISRLEENLCQLLSEM